MWWLLIKLDFDVLMNHIYILYAGYNMKKINNLSI